MMADLSPKNDVNSAPLEARNDECLAFENLGISNRLEVNPHVTWMVEHDTEPGKWKPFKKGENNRIESTFQAAASDSSMNDRVPVDGGRYEVLLNERVLRATYWEEKKAPRKVVRATWFFQKRTSGDFQWAPYGEEDQDAIEDFFLRLYNGAYGDEKYPTYALKSAGGGDGGALDLEGSRRLAAVRKPASSIRGMPQFLELVPAPCYLRPCGTEKEPFVWEIYQENTSILKPGKRLVRRGYPHQVADEEERDECEIPVSHVFFVMHGIGENMWSLDSVPVPSIRQVCCDFRALMTAQLAQLAAELPQAQREGAEGRRRAAVASAASAARVECLPVEWYAAVHEEETELTARLQDITLPTIPMLRNLANDVVLDVMLYLQPSFQQKILTCVGRELERLRAAFLARHPGYAGGFSLLAHSLGSIISFDLLSGQRGGGGGGAPPPAAADLRVPGVEYPQLSFDLEDVLMLGSPTALFLALRAARPPRGYRLPRVRGRFLNVFHPSDPVAYRLEPLVDRRLRELPPSYVPDCRGGGLKLHLAVSRWNREVSAAAGKLVAAAQALPSYSPAAALGALFRRKAEEVDAGEEKAAAAAAEEEQVTLEGAVERVRLNGGRRVDLQLQTSLVEHQSEYLSALGSHTSYFGNADLSGLCVQQVLERIVPPEAVLTGGKV